MNFHKLNLIWASCLALTLCHPAFAAGRRDTLEDSLQNRVAEEPDNPDHWMALGALAARNAQSDLAKGYFDEAIKLSGRSGKTILEVGKIWLSLGRVRSSLAYLMPNLGHLEPEQLDQLQAALEREKQYSAQLIVLRHLGTRTKAFQPVNKKAAMLASRLGDLAVSQAILAKYVSELDFESARNLLLMNLFLSSAPDQKALASLTARFQQAEIGMLVHLNYAILGRWKEVKGFLAKEANSAAYRDYYYLIAAMEAAAADRHEDAAELFQKAQESSWDRLRVITVAELYRLYSSTGNKFKAEQLWETLKEEYAEQDPELQEFMAKQMQIRGYEKQGKYFYRVLLRRRPGNTAAMKALFEDLMANEETQVVTDNLKALLERDQFSCEGNTMAMTFQQRQRNDKELLPYARNATVYCYESLEPYFALGTALLNMSKPEEARVYFSTFIRRGGDVSRVPISVR